MLKLLAAQLPWSVGGPGIGLRGLAFHAPARPPDDLQNVAWCPPHRGKGMDEPRTAPRGLAMPGCAPRSRVAVPGICCKRVLGVDQLGSGRGHGGAEDEVAGGLSGGQADATVVRTLVGQDPGLVGDLQRHPPLLPAAVRKVLTPLTEPANAELAS